MERTMNLYLSVTLLLKQSPIPFTWNGKSSEQPRKPPLQGRLTSSKCPSPGEFPIYSSPINSPKQVQIAQLRVEMSKSESSDLSPCEKTMSIMVNILKISALPVARMGAKQLGQHKHGKLLAGNGLADELPPAGQRGANRKPQMNGQPSYVMEPADAEVEDQLRMVLKQQTVDINDRADEFIRRMRKRMEQMEEVGSGDVSRKLVKSSTTYNMVAK